MFNVYLLGLLVEQGNKLIHAINITCTVWLSVCPSVFTVDLNITAIILYTWLCMHAA